MTGRRAVRIDLRQKRPRDAGQGVSGPHAAAIPLQMGPPALPLASLAAGPPAVLRRRGYAIPTASVARRTTPATSQATAHCMTTMATAPLVPTSLRTVAMVATQGV